jgi:hypothetical protein
MPKQRTCSTQSLPGASKQRSRASKRNSRRLRLNSERLSRTFENFNRLSRESKRSSIGTKRASRHSKLGHSAQVAGRARAVHPAHYPRQPTIRHCPNSCGSLRRAGVAHQHGAHRRLAAATAPHLACAPLVGAVSPPPDLAIDDPPRLAAAAGAASPHQQTNPSLLRHPFHARRCILLAAARSPTFTTGRRPIALLAARRRERTPIQACHLLSPPADPVARCEQLWTRSR